MKKLDKYTKIEVVYHYSKEEGTDGDYSDVEIKLNGKQVQTYDDDYHDKGRDKVVGWLDCYKFLMGGSAEPLVLHAADRKW